MADSIVRIGGGTVSNTQHLVIPDLSADYIKYEIAFSELRTSTTNGYLHMMFSTDNGSTWATGYSSRIEYYTSHTLTDSSAMRIADQIGAQSVGWDFFCCSGTIEIFDPMNANSRTTVLARLGGFGWNQVFSGQRGSGQRNAAEANNAVRISGDNGSGATNFNMNYVVYGYLA